MALKVIALFCIVNYYCEWFFFCVISACAQPEHNTFPWCWAHQRKECCLLLSKHGDLSFNNFETPLILFFFFCFCFFKELGADYMANFSPGWNFSPVSRAKISPRPPEQLFLKRRLRLHGENFSPGWISARAEISSPVSETGLGFSVRAEIQKNLM